MGLFRRLFGGKKAGHSPPANEKRRWSFARSSHAKPSQSNKGDTVSTPYDDSLDASKHAIAVAAATAAVAEAALAAAQAAAEVVRLTSGAGGGAGRLAPTEQARINNRRWAEELAAMKIQSAFRGYLAKRALRALKALVKLQALVRGHIVRKQTADMLRRMQTLVRVQARARASRSHVSESWHSASQSSHIRYTVPASPHKDHLHRAYSTKFDGPSILKRCGSNSNLRESIVQDKAKFGSNWLDRWMEESIWNNHGKTPLKNRHSDDEKSDKILEVDTWKPHMNSQPSNMMFWEHVLASDHNNPCSVSFDSPLKRSTKASNPIPTVYSAESISLNPRKLPLGKEDAILQSDENSPQAFSASSRPGSSCRKGPSTPTRSECSWGFFNGYSGYPNYMANTESSRAKVRSQSSPRQRVEFEVRSQSAPRQRLEFEKYGSSKRYMQGFFDTDTKSERGFLQQTDFSSKAYPASGRMNRVRSTNFR